MTSLFLDANIYIAVYYSLARNCRKILDLCREGKCEAIITDGIMNEVGKALSGRPNLDEVLVNNPAFRGIDFKYQELSEEVELKEKYRTMIERGDVHVLVGAHVSEADFLVTLDRKDFCRFDLINANLPFTITTPSEFLKDFWPYM